MLASLPWPGEPGGDGKAAVPAHSSKRCRMRRLVYAAVSFLLVLLPAAAIASLGVESNFLRLLTAGGPTGNERILWSGKFSILPDTNGISPGTEDLVFTLESFVPDPESPDGGAFVQQYSAVVPAGGLMRSEERR